MEGSSIAPGNLIVFAEKGRSEMRGNRFPLIEVQWEDVE